MLSIHSSSVTREMWIAVTWWKNLNTCHILRYESEKLGGKIFEGSLGFTGWIQWDLLRFAEILQDLLSSTRFGGILQDLVIFYKIWWDSSIFGEILQYLVEILQYFVRFFNILWDPSCDKTAKLQGMQKSYNNNFFKIISKSTRHTEKSENTFNPFIRHLDLIAKRSAQR